ncbi:MAG: hypothetical protein M0R48_06390 [Candidatus Omnitrophica bacterium]|jgi:hypothetical protein|nr:hypothetical protein [Candidatus Omnitrophota bacterium]
MKYVVNVIAIFVVVIIVVLAVTFRNNTDRLPFQYEIKKFFNEFSQMIKTRTANVKMELAPSRRKKTTFIDKEEQLRQFIPDVFGKFSESDWRNFWSFIYDPVYDKKSKYGGKRYRTKEEIESFLRNRFSIFNYLDIGHWHYFWSIVDVKFE